LHETKGPARRTPPPGGPPPRTTPHPPRAPPAAASTKGTPVRCPRYAFTKILVDDLAAQFAFYSSVFGRVERTRYEFDDRADPLAEIIMTSPDGTEQSLVLLHYKNRPAPAPGSAVIGFEVSGLDEVVRRAEEAGATVSEPPTTMTDIGIRVAFVHDPEGHLLELFERI
uniref:VOC family protein n=1 Tax=Nocardia farcinica TaxID=37329 RepID=UPI002455644F